MKETRPGIYWWYRNVDETGISGAGVVGTACIHPDMSVSFRWDGGKSGVASWSLYEALDDFLAIMGHGERKTGRLVPVINVGQYVVVASFEGFSGVAKVEATRPGQGEPYDYYVVPQDGHQPGRYWAWGYEVLPYG